MSIQHLAPGRAAARAGTGMAIASMLCVQLGLAVSIGLFDRIAFHEVANALDPAHATPTTCASAFS